MIVNRVKFLLIDLIFLTDTNSISGETIYSAEGVKLSGKNTDGVRI